MLNELVEFLTRITYLVWKLIFVLSNGAMEVFANAPAIEPHAKFATTTYLAFFGASEKDIIIYLSSNDLDRKIGAACQSNVFNMNGYGMLVLMPKW